MKMKGSMNISFVTMAVFLLWIKTYIVYKTSFDINIENYTQEIILFINPLSFLMLIFGISFWINPKNRTGYIVATSLIISLILYANVVYYRFFNDFLTVPVLFQTSNMSDLGSSVTELITITDLLYFSDCLLLFYLIKFRARPVNNLGFTTLQQRAFMLLSLAMTFFNLGLAESERPQLLTRTFDREILVKNIGTYHYHIYDIFLQSKSSAQRALADGSKLADIENYVRANYIPPKKELFGIAQNKNVILISMESVQNFVINAKVNDEEITPFLNEFIEDSFYFDHFYHQTGQGKTSDSEFIVDNSLYPLSRGAVFFTHSANEYHAIPEVLDNHGYYTASLHANNKSFWNRDIMYKSLGYDRFFSYSDYEISKENSVGWGLKDIDFFQQSVQHLKDVPKPFYAKFITLTNHFPFELDEQDRFVKPFTSNDKTVNQYFLTVRYLDEALKTFINELKSVGLYENSIIILYGDHYGISENHNKAMEEFLAEDITPYVSTQLQRVPLIVHIPGMKGHTLSSIGGQIDLKPTILHLLGIETKADMQFGSDLFSQERMDIAVLRDGSFITKDYLFTRNTCYSSKTGEQVEKALCNPYLEKAKTELGYSDQIIYGDLLRFYGQPLRTN
ncbi:MAG: LTA synthase family protein [Bacillota bacterium]